MRYFKWVIAGFMGGGIGGAIWVAVGYYSEYEVGWIAWGVGFLAGLGVRLAAQEEDGWMPGAAATAAAVVSVLLAKYAVVVLAVNAALGELSDFRVTDVDTMIAVQAQEVVEEFEEAGRKVNWPPETDSEDATIEEQYPPDVWAEAKKRWNQLPPREQQARTKAYEERVAETLGQLKAEIRSKAFSESFSPWDLLWFGLAAVTAFKLGSGLTSDEE